MTLHSNGERGQPDMDDLQRFTEIRREMDKSTVMVGGDLRKEELRYNSFHAWSPLPLWSPSLPVTCGELGTER